MMKLDLRFLGSVEILADGRPVAANLDRKEIALLAFLAVEGKQTLRSKVAGLFWAKKSDEHANKSLRQALLNIEKRIPGTIIRHGRLALSLDESVLRHTDVWQFEQHIRHNNLDQAIVLYHGRFLDSLSLLNADGSEEWFTERQRYYERRALDCLRSLMITANDKRDNEALGHYARRVIDIDPFQEEAYRYLMLAQGRQKQFNKALQVFTECAEMLRHELAVPPAAETIYVREQILSARAAPKAELPFNAATFVGRTRELAAATTHLLNPACRLLTLLGPGGVGKTRLAAELARRIRHWFLHDLAYLSLDGWDKSDSEDDLLVAIASSLGLPPDSGPLRSQLANHLRSREMLLVLDNFEFFTPVAGVFHSLLKEAPNVKLLVTSRERLDIVEETVLNVRGMSYPSVTDFLSGSPSTDGYDAPVFFAQSVARLNPLFTSSDNPQKITEICLLVEGLPLAIELIAPWTLEMSLDAIVTRLSVRPRDLLTSERRFPDRHRSLNVVFEHSWSRLSFDEQAVLRRLAIIDGIISTEVASAIAGATEPTLRRLVARSMLNALGEGRYAFHSLVRGFALSKLIAVGEHDQFLTRHFDYFHQFVAFRLPQLSGAEQLNSLRYLEEAFINIRAAWRYGAQSAPIEALQTMMEGIVHLCKTRTWYTVGIEALQEVSGLLAQRGMDNLHTQLLLHQGRMHYVLGNYEDAWHRAEVGLRKGEALQNKSTIAQALYLMSLLYYEQNYYDEAEPLLLHSIDLQRGNSEWEAAGTGLIQLGNLVILRTFFSAQNQSNFEPPAAFVNMHSKPTPLRIEAAEMALRCYEEALSLFTQAGSLLGTASYWGAVGLPYYILHEYEKAADSFGRAVRLFRELGSISNEGQSANWFAWVLFWQGKWAESRSIFHEALRLGLSVAAHKHLLDCLQKYSLFLWSVDKEHFTPLAINIFVAQHPSTDGRMRATAERWYNNIRKFMLADEGEEAVEQAHTYGLQQTITSFVYTLVGE